MESIQGDNKTQGKHPEIQLIALDSSISMSEMDINTIADSIAEFLLRRYLMEDSIVERESAGP